MAGLILSVLALGAAATQGQPPSPGPVRFAQASATATVRILTPALIGADYGAPRPGMEPRTLRVALPDGRSTAISVYEFE